MSDVHLESTSGDSCIYELSCCECLGSEHASGEMRFDKCPLLLTISFARPLCQGSSHKHLWSARCPWDEIRRVPLHPVLLWRIRPRPDRGGIICPGNGRSDGDRRHKSHSESTQSGASRAQSWVEGRQRVVGARSQLRRQPKHFRTSLAEVASARRVAQRVVQRVSPARRERASERRREVAVCSLPCSLASLLMTAAHTGRHHRAARETAAWALCAALLAASLWREARQRIAPAQGGISALESQAARSGASSRATSAEGARGHR